MTKQQVDALAAGGKIRSHNAPKGANLDDLPAAKGVLPKGGSMSLAKKDFISGLRLFCKAAGLVLLEEQVFDPVRKWRLDFVVTGRGRPAALEYQGIMSEGINGHTGIQHYVDDCDKIRAAQMAGLMLLPYNARDYHRALSDLDKLYNQ